MPSVASHPALHIKGFNPYASAVLNREGRNMTPQAPAVTPQTQTHAQQGMAFMANDVAESGLAADYYQDTFQNQTSIEANNVTYRLMEGHLKVKIPYAQVQLTDRTPEDAMHLEGLDFNMNMQAGQVSVSDVDVSITLGRLLDQQKAPVKNLRVTFDPDNQINVSGKLSKFGLAVPFKVQGHISATAQGEVKYALGRVSVMGIPVNGLMKTFGLSIEKTLKLNDPAKGYHAVGNTVYINPNQILAQPGIQANLSQVTTHLGNLVATFGNTPEQAQSVQTHLQRNARLNGIEIRGGHYYYDGYFIKDGVVRMEDKTPNTPLEMEKTGETILNLQKGFVGVSDPKFSGIIQAKLGDDSSLKNATTRLKSDAAELKGNMWGMIPIQLDLAFDKTAEGKLMFTAQNAKALGFIPLPDSLIRKQVQGMVDGGIPYGNGVALDSLGDTHIGRLKQVQHQAGYLVLEAGNN